MVDIHPQLSKDCVVIGRFPLCHLLLMNDKQYPWFVLVPDREGISEIYQLSGKDQLQLNRESVYLSRTLASSFSADKMNIAALGNVVPQLHIHHIVRYKNDIAWPDPVWGKYPAQNYGDEELGQMIQKLKMVLDEDFVFSPQWFQ